MHRFLCIVVLATSMKIQGLFSSNPPVNFENKAKASPLALSCNTSYCVTRGASCVSDTDLVCCKCRCKSGTRYYSSYGRCIFPNSVASVLPPGFTYTTNTPVLTSLIALNTSISSSIHLVTTTRIPVSSKKNYSDWRSSTVFLMTTAVLMPRKSSSVSVKSTGLFTQVCFLVCGQFMIHMIFATKGPQQPHHLFEATATKSVFPRERLKEGNRS